MPYGPGGGLGKILQVCTSRRAPESVNLPGDPTRSASLRVRLGIQSRKLYVPCGQSGIGGQQAIR